MIQNPITQQINYFLHSPIDFLITFYIAYLYSTEKSEFLLHNEKNLGTSLKFCMYIRLHNFDRPQ